MGLAVEACRQRKRVRFTTAAELVNELIEAKNQSELNRVTYRWLRYQLIVIDEMAYVAMPESAVELLFQVISGRAERASVIVTTNLPFSEWNTMFPNARLCKAMLDRLTDQAHIIDTGKESYRFRRTLEKKKGRVTESSRVQFRAELFNLPNTPYFSSPNSQIDVAAGGRVTATQNSHTTRGRAHLLFEMMRGDVIADGWRDEHVKESLDRIRAANP